MDIICQAKIAGTALAVSCVVLMTQHLLCRLEVNKQVGFIMGDLVKQYPQEWSRVVPLVHFVMMNTELGSSGFTARDLDRCWSMRDHTERELVSFDVGPVLPVQQCMSLRAVAG